MHISIVKYFMYNSRSPECLRIQGLIWKEFEDIRALKFGLKYKIYWDSRDFSTFLLRAGRKQHTDPISQSNCFHYECWEEKILISWVIFINPFCLSYFYANSTYSSDSFFLCAERKTKSEKLINKDFQLEHLNFHLLVYFRNLV